MMDYQNYYSYLAPNLYLYCVWPFAKEHIYARSCTYIFQLFTISFKFVIFKNMPCISIFHLCLSTLYLFGLLESPVLHSITNLLKELLILSLYFHYPKLSACKDKNQNVSKDMMNHVPTRVHTIS